MVDKKKNKGTLKKVFSYIGKYKYFLILSSKFQFCLCRQRAKICAFIIFDTRVEKLSILTYLFYDYYKIYFLHFLF